MVQGTVLYKKIPSDICDGHGSDRDDEEDEEDEVTVYLQSPPAHQHSSRKWTRDTWIRFAVALVLLSIVLGFVLCEWHGCLQDQAPHRGHMQTGESHEGHRHHHEGEDEDEDRGHEEEENHNHHGHSHHGHSEPNEHSHSGSLFHHGVTITDSAVCSRAGKELLQEDGNVVDAGIAALLCLGVVHPHTAGVGGVFSAILYNHSSGSLKAIHSSFAEASSTTYGVPATLQGIKLLHSQFGHSEWKRLFQSAIRLAKDGFQIDEILARALETNKEKILQSKLCDLFCDTSGRVKSLDSYVTNQNLSELLQSVSLNDSHLPEKLAMKLAEDLSPTERPDFVGDVRRCRGEINEPLIVEKEKYTIFSAAFPLSGTIISDVLERAREQSFSLQSHGDLNCTASSYISLLNLAKEIYNNARTEEKLGLRELPALHTASSHIGVLDSRGNVFVVSASLNSSWGSQRFLPSSGVILSDFVSNFSTDLLQVSFPLLIKIKDLDGDEDDEADEEVQVVAVTGGLSALFNAAQIVTNRVDLGMPALEAVASPLIHFEPGGSGSLFGCVSAVSNGSDVYRLLSESDCQLQAGEECTDGSLAIMLQLHAGHVGAYGAPAAKAHADGY